MRQESEAVYTLRDFTIHEDSPETPQLDGHQGRRRTASSHQKSQSEHDWAYAKRALARGDDVELVIQRIADYRSDEKDNPNYYARHTVMKAQAELVTKFHDASEHRVTDSARRRIQRSREVS